MKHKISISIDEDTYWKVRNSVKSGRFRNKSHAFEQCLLEALKDE